MYSLPLQGFHIAGPAGYGVSCTALEQARFKGDLVFRPFDRVHNTGPTLIPFCEERLATHWTHFLLHFVELTGVYVWGCCFLSVMTQCCYKTALSIAQPGMWSTAYSAAPGQLSRGKHWYRCWLIQNTTTHIMLRNWSCLRPAIWGHCSVIQARTGVTL